MVKKFLDVETDFNGAPFATSLPAMASGKGYWDKMLGIEVPWVLDFTGGSNFAFCLSKEGWSKVGHVVFEKVKANPSYVEEIERHTVPLAIEAENYAMQVAQMDLRSKTGKEMCEILDVYLSKILPSFAWGLQLPALDFEPELYFTNFLKSYLKKAMPMAVEETFSVLTANTEQKTFAGMEEEDFLKLATLPEKERARALEQHAEKYCWIPWGWRGPTKWDLTYYQSLLASSKADPNFNPASKLKEKKEAELVVKQRQKELEEKISLEMQQYFAVARKVGWLKPYRKELQIKSIYYFESWVKEASRRTGIPLELFRFLTMEEMKEAINGKEFSLKLLQQRRSSSVCLVDGGVQKIYIGAEADKIRSQIERQKVDLAIKELQGTIAMPGKGRGTVRIVNSAEDMAKMKRGDVLVSVSTNPALLPAMKLAAAIVTDIGGLTCHAAIVSRELGIQCIIGTKVATKWLKDGELIEVDPIKGVVRKV